jgi:hypothetical protein
VGNESIYHFVFLLGNRAARISLYQQAATLRELRAPSTAAQMTKELVMKRKSDESPWETADGEVRSAPHSQGMVIAVRSGVVLKDGIRETVEAGKTWIWKRHRWLRDPSIAALFGLGGALDGRRAANWLYGEAEPWRLEDASYRLPAPRSRGGEAWRI